MNGTLSRFGSVVRNGKHIIAHLDDANFVNTKKVKSVAHEIIKNKKFIFVGLALTAVTAGGVAIAKAIVKNKKDKIIPIEIKEFNELFGKYLIAIQNKSLNEELVLELIDKIEVLKNAIDNGEIEMNFSAEQVETLIDIIVTKQLAKANSYNIVSFKINSNHLDNLNHCLEIQNEIFKNAS